MPEKQPAAATPAKVADEAEAKAAAAEVAVPAPSPESVPVDAKPEELAARLLALIEGYETASTTLAEQRTAIEQRESSVTEQAATLAADVEQLQTDRAALAGNIEDLHSRREAVAKREADADAGFLARRDEIFGTFEADHAARVKELTGRQAELDAAIRSRAEAADSRIAQREAELDKHEEALRERERQIKTTERRAKADLEDAEDLREHVDDHIQKRVAQLVEDKDAELDQVRETLAGLRTRTQELEAKLDERDRAARTLEHMTPEAVRAKIDALTTECERLRDELAARPTASEAAELSSLRDERAQWQEARQQLLAARGRLESRLENLQIEVDSMEALRDRNQALLQTQRLLKEALDDLRNDIEERLDKHRGQPVYPELLRVSEDVKFAEPPARLYPGESDELDLGDFASELGHRVGEGDADDPKRLFFRPQDVRAFLGGLAMSRLHLLQGISGIGKSSLPRRFAKAVGGFCDTISVQAGWRDRNDLLGYYNAFERRYYESPFIQALFKAQTRKWSDRLVIVLLDEMNLSHPEQYAADVLDVLERTDRSKRVFELLPFTPRGDTPRGLSDGRFLPLPENVWFVGTANHDETTKDFADKTYDRSFVLELPSRPEELSPKRTQPRPPVSCTALRKAFDDAAEEYSDNADEAWAWIDRELREPMLDRFNVGFGGRLETQAKRFMPVVFAAGGREGEALDQLVASRILRKIRSRHDNLEEDLVHVEGLLKNRWPDKSAPPEASLAILERELRLKRG